MFKAAAENAAQMCVDSLEATQLCPLCDKAFPESAIQNHVDQCLSMAATTTSSTASENLVSPEDSFPNPGQWAEMTRCELEAILHQGVESRDLRFLEETLQRFVEQIQQVKSRAQ